ncbi:hypothetical protein [Aestuariivirga sp.]|uniref:hypothetical protein n=1 Tax=Aestuariivirga sp. TaxID=2650926 RepID=UPI0039E3199E
MKWILTAAALASLGSSAQAADLSVPETSDPGLVLQITPYLWGAGLEGDVSPFKRGPTIDVDKDFSDILEHLNMGGFVNIWGRYDRFVFSGDIMYVSTTDKRHLSISDIPLTGQLDTKQFTSTLMGGYRVLDDAAFTLDALAGGRFWHISNDVTATAGPLTGKYGEKFSWVDPVIGLRAFYNITDKFSILAQADVGGFGIGSKSTWQVLGTANYRFTDNISMSAGYKILAVDYRNDGHVFDTKLAGPVAGITFRF